MTTRLGFACSSPYLCCGSDNERFCCIPSTPSSSFLDDSYSVESTSSPSTDRWFSFRMGLLGVCLIGTIFIIVMIYQCLTSLHQRKERRDKLVAPRPISLATEEQRRPNSHRISTISSTTASDVKSRCTDTSFVLQTSLNLYPNQNTPSRNSSASFYIFPSEFERLCHSPNE